MRSKIIFVLFLVVGLLASQTLSHSYWFAYCGRSRSPGERFAKHAFCEAEHFSDCENKWTDYSINSEHRGAFSPCHGNRRSFRDHRGKHWLECESNNLVALRHGENQEKDNCTSNYNHIFNSVIWETPLYMCYSKWKCGGN